MKTKLEVDPQAARRIKELRESLGLKPAEFAAKLGFTNPNSGSSQVSKAEHGHATMSFLVKVAKTFNVSLDWLTGKTNGHLTLSPSPGQQSDNVERGLFHLQPHPSSILVRGHEKLVLQFCDTLTALENAPDILCNAPDGNDILLPTARPFMMLAGHRALSFVVDRDVGMKPVINIGDLVVVNADDVDPVEKQIYLVYHERTLTLRYASTVVTPKDGPVILMWAEERKYKESRVYRDKPSPILGRVVVVCNHFHKEGDEGPAIEPTDPFAMALRNKRLFISENLNLTKKEEKGFWPLFEEYQARLYTLGERSANMIRRFAGLNGRDEKEQVMAMMAEHLDLEAMWPKLRQEFLPKFRNVLPEIKVARYYQIENKLRIAWLYQVAKAVPLAGAFRPDQPLLEGGP